jgi:hypothetical protein
MKINFTQPLKTLDGTELKIEGKTRTTAQAVMDSLLFIFQDEANLPGEEKVKRYKLANRIYQSKCETDLTIEEAALIKKLTGKLFGPLIVGQIWSILEGLNQ